MRPLTEIQTEDLALLAERAGELKQSVLGLITEIERDHYRCDDDTAWEIVLGARPSFLTFHLKGLLEVLVDDVLDDLESSLRGAVVVTDEELEQEWREQQRGATGPPLSGSALQGALPS